MMERKSRAEENGSPEVVQKHERWEAIRRFAILHEASINREDFERREEEFVA